MIADHFRIGCSSIHSIMGPIGLTHKQYWEMKRLQYRRMGQHDNSPVWTVNKAGKREGGLSKNMAEKLRELQRKHRYPELPAGAKTICDKWFKETVYGRKKSFKSNQTDKGDINEEEAIVDLIGPYIDSPFIRKEPETYKTDGFIQTRGCDILEPEDLYDNKCSYDTDTFPLNDEKPEQKYVYQVLGYYHLFNRRRGGIFHTLTDMPDSIVEKLTQYECRDMGIPFDLAVFDRIKKHYSYDDLPIELRVKYFPVEWDAGFIKDVHQRVVMCRDFIRTMEEKLNVSRDYREMIERRITEGRRTMRLEDALTELELSTAA